MLPYNSFTYISDATHSTTWLDHYICSADFEFMIQNMDILYETTNRNHIPVLCNIELKCAPERSSDKNLCEPKLNWAMLPKYIESSGIEIDEIIIRHTVLTKFSNTSSYA